MLNSERMVINFIVQNVIIQYILLYIYKEINDSNKEYCLECGYNNKDDYYSICNKVGICKNCGNCSPDFIYDNYCKDCGGEINIEYKDSLTIEDIDSPILKLYIWKVSK